MNLHFYKERKKGTKESKGVDQIRVFENTLYRIPTIENTKWQYTAELRI